MQSKTSFKNITISYSDFTMERFINYLMEHLHVNSHYSILVKLGFKNNSVFYMSGKQIGIKIANSHDIKYYKDIYNVILYRIELVMEYYDQDEYPVSIMLEYKNLNLSDSLVLPSLKSLNLENKSIFVKKDLSKIFSKKYLPLTLEPNYYGIRVDGSLKLKYLNQLKSNILKNGGKVPKLLESSENIEALSIFIDKVKYRNIDLKKIIINCHLKDYTNSNKKWFFR